MTGGNALRRRWLDGQGGIGGWCQLPSPLSAEIMGRAGFDWVCVDMQHGPTTIETAAAMVQAISVAGAVPIVRVPANDARLIGQALDVGASGVIVPLVNTRAEAERAAAACRYPPDGLRSFGPVRTPGAVDGDPRAANEHVLCLVMVETGTAVENVDEICSVPGVDGVYVGPWDLSLSVGSTAPGPEIEPLLERILEACRRHGVEPGIATGSGKSARARLEAGFTWVAVSGDIDFLARHAREELAAAGREPTAPGAAEGLVHVAL